MLGNNNNPDNVIQKIGIINTKFTKTRAVVFCAKVESEGMRKQGDEGGSWEGVRERRVEGIKEK